MGFFYRKQPRRFNYIPRYYDPAKEEWEKKKAEKGLEANLSHEEQLRMQMRAKWGHTEEEETPAERRSRLIRRVVLGALILFIFYFVFCTPVLTNIVSGLMGK